jgi:3-oxoisoapionate decarboxylase
MDRRQFLASTFAAAAASRMSRSVFAQAVSARPSVRIGVDVFSLQSQNFTPFQALDYCSRLGARVVHFSEIRFLGSLESENLLKVKQYAKRQNLDLEIGMRSICPSSSMFDASAGTAEQQLGRMIQAAQVIGSPIVRCVLGSSNERTSKLPLEAHIENTIKVLKNIRSQASDANIRIAIENHAGDMQARELKSLVEGAGKDFVGVCIDSGNPMWTLESPHLTLETLHPYVLTSHLRDSYVWLTDTGAVAVRWCRTGEGNIDIDSYVKKYIALCPGRALTSEIIVQPQPRMFAVRDPKFWDGYKSTPAWEYERFIELAEQGKAPAASESRPPTPRTQGPRVPLTPEQQGQRLATQREDLDVSIQYVQRLLTRL